MPGENLALRLQNLLAPRTMDGSDASAAALADVLIAELQIVEDAAMLRIKEHQWGAHLRLRLQVREQVAALCCILSVIKMLRAPKHSVIKKREPHALAASDDRRIDELNIFLVLREHLFGISRFPHLAAPPGAKPGFDMDRTKKKGKHYVE
jgi:hypothetical protein